MPRLLTSPQSESATSGHGHDHVSATACDQAFPGHARTLASTRVAIGCAASGAAASVGSAARQSAAAAWNAADFGVSVQTPSETRYQATVASTTSRKPTAAAAMR